MKGKGRKLKVEGLNNRRTAQGTRHRVKTDEGGKVRRWAKEELKAECGKIKGPEHGTRHTVKTVEG